MKFVYFCSERKIFPRHYKQAYLHLLEIKLTDVNNLEVKTVAGFINYKVLFLVNKHFVHELKKDTGLVENCHYISVFYFPYIVENCSIFLLMLTVLTVVLDLQAEWVVFDSLLEVDGQVVEQLECPPCLRRVIGSDRPRVGLYPPPLSTQ